MQNSNTYKIRILLRKLTNKYTITGFIFLVWIGFLDGNSYIEKMHIKKRINILEKEEAYYKEKIDEDNRKMQELLSNRDNIEKFAREQYLMKNKNEDIFVIVKD